MPNIYESDSFNILEVYKTPVVETDEIQGNCNHYFVRVQRLPEINYPHITEIHIPYSTISADSSKNDFISFAPSFISSKLTEYDSTFDNSEITETTDTTSFTQVFN